MKTLPMPTSFTSLRLAEVPEGRSAELVIAANGPETLLGSPRAVQRAKAMLGEISLMQSPGSYLEVSPTPSGQPSRLLMLRADESDLPLYGRWSWVGAYLFAAMEAAKLDTVILPSSKAIGGEAQFGAFLDGVLGHSFQLQTGKLTEQDFRPAALVVDRCDRRLAEQKFRENHAVNRVRAWVEQPSNRLVPPVFAREACDVLSAIGAKVRIAGPVELEEMGANLLHAVGRGSEFGAHLFAAEWRGDPDRADWDAVLLGKGVTFDGGGLNLKSQPFISRMKLDKAGGAAVVGALELAIMRQSKANVAIVVPMVENSIDALAYRPGDVVRSLAGLVVEIADTDYEGRLALADAMTYAIRHYDPHWMIDIATLTTAVMATLHEDYAALMTVDDPLADALVAAGEGSGERLWRFPLNERQDYIVASDIADVRNVGIAGHFGVASASPAAGGKFLEKFAGNTRWAHIDMASMAVAGRPTARYRGGATGYGARLLDAWLQSIEPQ